MGTAALSFTVGGDLTHSLNMYKLLIASVLMAGAMAAPEADADAYYAAYYPALYNSYPNWPGVSTPFSSSTCFGCRGKRSAEPGYYAPAFYYGGFYPALPATPLAPATWPGPPRAWARGPLTPSPRLMPATTTVMPTVMDTPGPTAMATTPEPTAMVFLMVTDGNQLFLFNVDQSK